MLNVCQMVGIPAISAPLYGLQLLSNNNFIKQEVRSVVCLLHMHCSMSWHTSGTQTSICFPFLVICACNLRTFVSLISRFQDLAKADKLQGLMAEVKLKPSISQKEKTAIQLATDVQKCIEDLQSEKETVQKKVCFDLRNRMKEEAFAKEFKLQNGTSLISKMIQKTKGTHTRTHLGTNPKHTLAR